MYYVLQKQKAAAHLFWDSTLGQNSVAPHVQKIGSQVILSIGLLQSIRLELYSGASLYDCPALRQNHITAIFLRSQNDGLNGFFSLCDDRFPASGNDSSQNDNFPTADRLFQNGRWVNKMPPAVFWDGFLARQPSKMAAVWRIFAGQ